MRYSREDLLKTKTTLQLGWLKESLVSQYDLERTKAKELIPVDHGDREGTITAFDNGIAGRNVALYPHRDYRAIENIILTALKSILALADPDKANAFRWVEWLAVARWC